MSIGNLLLITGAGASRDLNAADTQPLPLMQDWARRLRDELGPGLAAMTTLDKAETGPEFEETLGALFRWRDSLDDVGRFAGMASPTFHQADGAWIGQVQQAVTNGRQNLQEVESKLNKSLFDEFGPQRLDPEKCVGAYKSLLDQFGGHAPNLVWATTNYDRSPEMALGETSAVRTGVQPHGFRSPHLQPSGIGTFSRSPSVIYLHGAVGWYVTSDGSITATPADAGFNSTLGRPAVLYPDPSKEVERTETAELWQEFGTALTLADHVLIIGHSLNDPHLVAALREPSDKRVGYVVFAEDQASSHEAAAEIRQRLPKGATLIPGRFGPEPWLEPDSLSKWRDG
jgi:hypothetical protein